MSLDGVLNGDLPPNLVMGFSFCYSGGRPVHGAEVVKNLGCRPVPMVSPPFPRGLPVRQEREPLLMLRRRARL